MRPCLFSNTPGLGKANRLGTVGTVGGRCCQALAVVAAARGVAVDVAPKADEVFEDWLGRYAACADEKA